MIFFFMAIIYETKNFVAEAFDKPHVTRLDEGDIKIFPKQDYSDEEWFLK